jgi:predicted ATP-grasp superfamily ATP-dependent carboligase
VTQTVILTIGRLPKALDFARSFHAAGWRVVVAEPYARDLTSVSRSVARRVRVPAPSQGKTAYLNALAEAVVAEKASLVLPLSEETMHVAALPAVLATRGISGVTVWTPPQEQLLQLHDKERFAALAHSVGLDAPLTARVGSDAATVIAAAGAHVVKPVFSCSGRGVSFHDAGAAPKMSAERMIVQALVRGQAVSTFGQVHGGRVVVNVVYRGTIASGTVCVGFERIDVPAVETWVARFAEATRYSGFVSFDFIVDAGGRVWAIECNPRVTSGVHFVENVDLAAAVLNPATMQPRLRPVQRLMQFYPALTEVQTSMFSTRFGANVKAMLSSRDVTFSASDPMPFITMPWTAWPILSRSMREKRSMGEIATDDISWFEGEQFKAQHATV